MINRSNYYQKSLQILDKIKKTYDFKPKLLMQVCCGPCSLYPLEMLAETFDITVIFNNSNLDTIEEFNRRLNVLYDVVKTLKETKGIEIPVIVKDYNHEEYMKDLLPYKDEKEGGNRCHICYKKRMEEAFLYAKANKFDFYTTSLTSSRQKSAFIINKIGEEIAQNDPEVLFFYSDFKKKGWAETGYKIAGERDYYLQEYCGCEYSKNNSK